MFVSKTDVSLVDKSNEDFIIMVDESECPNIDPVHHHNLESMQNISKKAENCFISPFLNDVDY